MEAGIPSVSQVRETHPAELAVVLSTLDVDAVFDLPAEAVEAVVVATQKVASWAHAIQACAVDRFADLAADELEVHVADLAARRGATTDDGEGSGSGPVSVVPVPEPDAIAASSLAPLLNISPRTMRLRLNRARVLMELPTTLSLALAGELEPWRVDGVVVAARDVAWDRLAEFEARLYAEDVARLPKPRLVARAAKAAVKADPESVTRARQAAPRHRGLRVAPSEVPGLMRWTADLPQDTSRQALAAVDALAREYLTADGHTGQQRSVEAARVDALTDLVMANASVTTVVELVVPATTAPVPTLVTRPDHADVIRDHLTRPLPGRPVVEISDLDPLLIDLVTGNNTRETQNAGTLERNHGRRLGEHLEIAGNPFLSTTGPPPTPGPPSPEGACTRSLTPDLRGPGEHAEPDRRTGSVRRKQRREPAQSGAGPVWFVDGFTQAPGATALLPEHVTAILNDPTTRLRVTTLDPGTHDGPPQRRLSYRPLKALADTVRARDGHCRFPGCSVPATTCDLDHLIPHPHGETCEANLHALCRAHHGFKHHAGWTVTMTSDGTCTWTAPTGRTHTTHPASRRDSAA